MTEVPPLRILIITGIFPPDIGGPATYVPQIATALAKRGHQVRVLTLSDHLPHDDSGYHFLVTRISRGKLKPWRMIETVTQILRLGRRADVLFVNGLALEAAIANLWLEKAVVQKVVGDVMWEWVSNRACLGDSFEDFQTKRYEFKVEALKTLRCWWTRQADRVIVPSRYLSTWVAKWGVPQSRISIIYNAVPVLSRARLDSVSPNERSSSYNYFPPACIPLATPVKVVTVGRLVPWKRVDKVIEAITQCLNVGLVIIGEGPERGQLERVAQALGVDDRVFFAGQRSKAETLSLMEACDLFVLNSTYEGLPHVVLEAMELGLPVIATAVGGTPEVVEDGENGRLLPLTDDGALLEVLLELLLSPMKRQHLANGAQHAIERFSARRMVEEVESVLWETAQMKAH